MLVMEYLPLSLTQCLEREELSLQMKHSILSDVAKALCYLHGKRPAIVHRDLTANNVLLTSLYSAKLSDLGVSRLIDKFKSHQQLTQVPGNAIVMPPEALATKPVYNEKVDVFTYGCLILHVLTCQFPEPTDAFVQYFMFWQSKVAEWDRRSRYIQKIPEDENDLLPLAKQCLQDLPDTRPDMLTVLRAVEEKCPKKRDEILLHIIREREETKRVLRNYVKTVEANTNEIKEKETELKELKREKKMCTDRLCQIESDYEADMEAKNAVILRHVAQQKKYIAFIEQQKVQQSMLEREKELCMDKLHELKSEHEAELKYMTANKIAEIGHLNKEYEGLLIEQQKLLEKKLHKLKLKHEEALCDMTTIKKAEIDTLKRKYEAIIGGQDKVLETKLNELKSKHEAELNLVASAKEVEIDSLQKECGTIILEQQEGFEKELLKLKSKHDATLGYMAAKEAEIKSHVAIQRITQTRLQTEFNKLKSKYDNDMAAKEAEIRSHITKQQEYKERRKLLQTWLGRGVESFEEKTFEMRKNRPILFYSTVLITIAIFFFNLFLIY